MHNYDDNFLSRLMNGDFVVDDQIDVETSVACVFVLARVAGFLSLGGGLARLLRLRLPVQLHRLKTHQLVVSSETHGRHTFHSLTRSLRQSIFEFHPGVNIFQLNLLNKQCTNSRNGFRRGQNYLIRKTFLVQYAGQKKGYYHSQTHRRAKL